QAGDFPDAVLLAIAQVIHSFSPGAASGGSPVAGHGHGPPATTGRYSARIKMHHRLHEDMLVKTPLGETGLASAHVTEPIISNAFPTFINTGRIMYHRIFGKQ